MGRRVENKLKAPHAARRVGIIRRPADRAKVVRIASAPEEQVLMSLRGAARPAALLRLLSGLVGRLSSAPSSPPKSVGPGADRRR